jgi:hypothetical protein
LYIDFTLLVLWIFVYLQKNALLQTKCSRRFIPSPLSIRFVIIFEFTAFCTFLRIFTVFLRKFSLELVSHQSKLPTFNRARPRHFIPSYSVELHINISQKISCIKRIKKFAGPADQTLIRNHGLTITAIT